MNSTWTPTFPESTTEEQWIDLYAFTLEPQKRVDFEMANWYTSTYPGSRFAEMLIVQKTTPEERIFLHDRELTVDSKKKTKTRQLSGHREVLRVLAETFGLHFPDGTEFIPGL